MIAGLLAMAAFAVYLMTLAPGVGFIDSGELSTVAATLGIAHPTGYPLFTLLGWVFAHLPVAREVVVRLNIMAALFCAAGLAGYFHVIRRLLLLTVAKGGSQVAATAAAALATLLLAFSETYWSEAVAVEVYSLLLLLVSGLLWTFFRANEPLPGEETRPSHWFLFGFAVGLAFTNHMTTVLLAPGLLFLYFTGRGWKEGGWRRLLSLVPFFLLGLSAYLYLPLRGAQSPALNWGYPVTPERFWWHFTGKQYRVWIFSSTEAAGRQLSYFFNALPAEFAYAGLAAAVIGLALLWQAHKKITAGLALLFAGCVAYSINYDIHDIDAYFLLAYIVTAIFAAAAFHLLVAWGIGRRGPAGVAAIVLAAGIALAPLAVHHARVDEGGNHLVDDYTMNMFASVESGAVVFSYQWDFWVSSSYYYQRVNNIRPDVVVVDKELLRRSWYLRELEARAPWLVAGSRREVDAFLREVEKFERDLPYDGAVIESKYAAMIGGMIRTGFAASRPVYVTGEIEPQYTAPWNRVPSGLAFRLTAGGGFMPTPVPEFRYRPFPRPGRLEDATRKLYADAFSSRAEYYYITGRDTVEAQKSLETAFSFDPHSPRVHRLRERFRLRL
jgi:hypothetical protein